MKKNAFTLIEVIVVVGVIGILMTASVYVLSGTFQGKTRVEMADNVEQNGSLILDELRKIGLEALGSGISCPAGGVGSSATIVSARDGGVTILSCVDGDKIASASVGAMDSGEVNFVGGGLRVSGCSTFISCDTLPSMGVAALNFDFNLQLGNDGYGGGLVDRNFRSRVVVRN